MFNDRIDLSAGFMVTPAVMDVYAGQNQSIPTRSTTPSPLVVRLMEPNRQLPATEVPVNFTITSYGGRRSTAGLSGAYSSSYLGVTTTSLSATTDSSGLARAYLEIGADAGTYTVRVTSAAAPSASVTFTVIANGVDPLASADTEKNLGIDPANNSSCGAATSASTAHPINIATGNKVRAEADYAGTGPFPPHADPLLQQCDSAAGQLRKQLAQQF